MSEPQGKISRQHKAASIKAEKAASAYNSQTIDGRLWFGILALIAGIIGSGMLFSGAAGIDIVRWMWFIGLLFFSLSAGLYLAYTLRVMYKTFQTVQAFDKYKREHRKFEAKDEGAPSLEILEDLSTAVKDYYEDYLDKPSKRLMILNIPTLLFGFYVSSVVSLFFFVLGSSIRIFLS